MASESESAVPPHAAGEEIIDGELLDTAECSAYPNEGRCTHVRCLLRERNSLAALVKRLSSLAASQAAPESLSSASTHLAPVSMKDEKSDTGPEMPEFVHREVEESSWQAREWGTDRMATLRQTIHWLADDRQRLADRVAELERELIGLREGFNTDGESAREVCCRVHKEEQSATIAKLERHLATYKEAHQQDTETIESMERELAALQASAAQETKRLRFIARMMPSQFAELWDRAFRGGILTVDSFREEIDIRIKPVSSADAGDDHAC